MALYVAVAAIAATAYAYLSKPKGAGPGDLSTPGLQLGTELPRVYGRMRLPVSFVSISAPRARAHRQGGKGGSGPKTYTYHLDALGVVCDGANVVAVPRIWRNKKPVYTALGASSAASRLASAQTSAWSSFQLLTGGAAQMPPPLYEARVGTANAIGFRGVCAIEFADLDCESVKTPPNLEAEVCTAATIASDCGTGLDQVADFWVLGAVVNYPNLWVTTGPQAEIVGNNQYFPPGGGIAVGINDLFSDFAPSTGCRYAEFKILRENSSSTHVGVVVGFARQGNRAISWIESGQSIPALASDPNVINLAVEFGTGKGWLGINGSWLTGDPATGAAPYWTGITGPLCLFLSYTMNLPDALWEMRTVEPDFDYPIPTGFFAWGCRQWVDAPRITPLPVSLASIISAELLRHPDVTAGDFDVTAVADIFVDGYSCVGDAWKTVGEICQLFNLDVVKGPTTRFLKRGRAAVAAVPFAHTGAGNDEPGEPFAGLRRRNDGELPAVTAVVFPSVLRDFENDVERGDRRATEGPDVKRLETRLVMGNAQAKGCAVTTTLIERAREHTAPLMLDDAYAALEPGDAITVTDDDGVAYRVRSTRIAYSDGVYEHQVELDDPSALVASMITDLTGQPAIEVAAPASVQLHLIDGPILRDADDGHGLYAVVTATGAWDIAELHMSRDGVEYTLVGTFVTRAVVGTVSALGAFAGWTWDDANTATLTLDAGAGGAPSSSTKAAVEASSTLNGAFIGAHGRWEAVRFASAPLVSPGVHLLSSFLRGQQGTEWAAGLHAAGDKFVLMQAGGTLRVPLGAGDVGKTLHFKAVPAGALIDDAVAQTLVYTAEGLKPYAPVNFRLDGAVLSWNRRSRLVYAALPGTLPPLGEASERYEVDVFNGATLLATLPVAVPNADLTAYPTRTRAVVYQMSEAVGRGRVAEILL